MVMMAVRKIDSYFRTSDSQIRQQSTLSIRCLASLPVRKQTFICRLIDSSDLFIGSRRFHTEHEHFFDASDQSADWNR